MKILVEPELESLLTGIPTKRLKWEFVVSGEASETPVNEWKVSFSVAWTPEGNTCFLRLVDLPDGDEDSYEEIVAAAVSAKGGDESAVVRALLEGYWAHGGKYIEYPYDYGRFDLGELV